MSGMMMLILGNTHLPMMMGMVCTPSPPRQIGKRSLLREVGMMPHIIKLPLRHTWVMLHQCNTSQEGHRGSTLVLMGGLAGTVGEDAAIADPLPTPMLDLLSKVSLLPGVCMQQAVTAGKGSSNRRTRSLSILGEVLDALSRILQHGLIITCCRCNPDQAEQMTATGVIVAGILGVCS